MYIIKTTRNEREHVAVIGFLIIKVAFDVKLLLQMPLSFSALREKKKCGESKCKIMYPVLCVLFSMKRHK